MEMMSYNFKEEYYKAVMPVSGSLDRIGNFIREVVCIDDDKLAEMLGALDLTGGKMFRPALLCLCAECFGGVREEHVKAGALVEILHAASLMHDDVIDGADNRRGRVNVNALFGNKAAILAGDLLLSKAMKIAASIDSGRVILAISNAVSDLCAGEIKQGFSAFNYSVTEAEYIDIVTRKSGSLFSLACRLGGLISGEAESVQESLAEFGENLGVAFQLTDDLLDFKGLDKNVGKPLKRDVRNGVVTLPLIRLLEQEKERALGLLEDSERIDFSELYDLLLTSGSFDYAVGMAKGYVERAKKCLGDVDDSVFKQSLEDLADQVVLRDF